MTKIPWSHIREAFSGEWVELVDYTWRGESLYPQAASIRQHSPDRAKLLRMIARAGRVEGAVVIFVGAALPPFVISAASTAQNTGL